MDAMHIRIHGLDDDESAARVEMAIYRLDGIASVIAVKSLGITSVLYYEQLVTRRAILRAVRDAGFEARIVRPEPALVAS